MSASSSWFDDVLKFGREAHIWPDRDKDLATELERQRPSDDSFDLSILTYNVNAFCAFPSASALRIRRALLASNAQVICLQETTPAWQAFLFPENPQDEDAVALAAKYPHFRFHSSRGCGGSAVLSVHSIISLSEAAPPVDGSWFPAAVIELDIPRPSFTPTRIRLVNCHLRPPVEPSGKADISTASGTNHVRLQEIRWLLSQVSSSDELPPSQPTIFLGDFNEGDMAPGLQHLCRVGFTDALNQHVPQSRETHRWPLGMLTLKKRLDHIVYSSAHFQAAYCYVLCGYEEGASDHQPVIAFLRFIGDN